MRRSEYFASPEGSLADYPSYPPYSELPFTSRKRRKQGNQFVKWSMRAVLASPIVVLVLWSTVAILFSNKQTSRMKMNTNMNKQPKQRMAAKQPEIQFMSPQGGIPPPPQGSTGSMMMLSQPDQQQNVHVVYPEQYNMAAQQQQQSLGVAASQTQINPELYMAANQNNQAAPPPPPLQATASQAVVTPQDFIQAKQRGATLPVVAPLGATAQTTPQLIVLPQQQQAPQEPPLQQEPQPLGEAPALGEAAPWVNTGFGEQAQPLGEAAPWVNTGFGEPQPVMEATSGGRHDHNIHSQAHHNMPRGVKDPPQQQVYYYDPKEATKNGNLQIPSTVYDANGQPIQLQALQGSAQIFMEPPQQRELPKQQLAGVTTQNMKQWGESTVQDQSIIISTVAVMALLVGALSARRMRARSFLSSCIENESLEDDVAYDTAYTTTDNTYNTFGGWKGDLEKFDV